MKNLESSAPGDEALSPWQRLKNKRISYFAIPLLIMATITEFVILATGWRYQQMVCLPQGMGVTFFGIGPIGATILAVELLKLPLAIWTASRHGRQKAFMLFVGLPLICLLTFQLVKDMAVYEMTTAMAPASQFLEKATVEETKIAQLNGELAAIEGKKTERQRKLDELAAKKAKAKAEYDELLKRNDESRQDAISLTEFQKKELSEVQARQNAIIAQFNADTEQINKALATLRTNREAEVGRATQWNTEEARIENAYKAKMAEYANKKAAYKKDKAEYDSANVLKRTLMKEPVDPGVPPEREVNAILKPTAIAEIDAQIKAKEAELLAVNNKRRESVAQVEADARRLRAEFDRRSSTKREQTDSKREELLAAQAALAAELKAEEKEADLHVATAVKNVDSIRGQIDAARKAAEGYYEQREAAIRNTQVHRIATTVEIVRGLFRGERPMSIKATAKERGDILTDQISMVRIWVYPVLAFIVAFLPTLMVEIGFSTIFQPETQRPPHRLGFLGRRMHALYTRAGRMKMARLERTANEASAEIASRNRALAEKEKELQAVREAMAAADAERAELTKLQEKEWVEKLAGMADTLNRTVIEKDALRDLQQSEIERQVQMRQNAWSERLTKMRQELDDQRAAAEAERTALMQEHQRKLMEVTEESKTQVIEARRQMADAELAAVEKNAKLSHDLKDALAARDAAEAQLKHQADSLALKLSQAKEDAAREVEKVVRQEKHRFERQQMEFENTLRQRDEDFERRLKQREQELSLAFDGRLAEEKDKIEQEFRSRETEVKRQFEDRIRELENHKSQDAQAREEAAQFRLKQREQQLQAQAESRFQDLQRQAEEQLRRREAELERQHDVQAREADARLKQELQQKELAFQAKLKQREQELTIKADARETELQNQWVSDLRVREEEWERQAQARIRAVETRFGLETQQKEEQAAAKARQRDQQWQLKLDSLQAELESRSESALSLAREQWEKETDKRIATAVEPYRTMLTRLETERDEAFQAASERARQVQLLEKKLTEASSFFSNWRNGKGTPVGA